MEHSELSQVEHNWTEELSSYRTGKCLEAEELLELTSKGKRSRNYGQQMAHVASCAGCKATLAALMEEPVRVRRPNFVWLAGPALAAAAVLAFALLRPNDEPLPNLQSKGDRAAPIPEARPGPKKDNVAKNEPEHNRGAIDPPKTEAGSSEPKYRAKIGGLVALNDGRWQENGVNLPSFAVSDVERLLQPPSTSRSGSIDNGVRLTKPDPNQRSLREPIQRLEWLEVANAANYKVTVEIKNGATWRSAEVEVERTSATIMESIGPGSEIRIRIEPVLDPVTAPADQVARPTTYLFTILSREQLKQAAWAAGHSKKAPIASSMVLYRLGLGVEAAKALPYSIPSKFSKWAEAIRREAQYDMALDR